MQLVLLVGEVRKDVIQYLREHRFKIVHLLPPHLQYKSQIKDVLVAPFEDTPTILETVKQLDRKPIAVWWQNENAVKVASLLNSHFNLPAISPKSAQFCTNKLLMREALSKSRNKISPDFFEVHDWKDIEKFISNHGFPVVLKPTNLTKSMLVTICDTREELIENFNVTKRLIDKTYKKYAPHENPQLIIEEFLDGTMHTVSGFVNSNGETQTTPGIIDIIRARETGIQDSYIYKRQIPSSLSVKAQGSIHSVAKKAVELLGICNGPFFAEIMLTSNGPMIIEVAIRLGGYRTRMYNLAYDIDLNDYMLRSITGKPLSIEGIPLCRVAVIEILSHTEGKFNYVKNLKVAQNLSSTVYAKIKVNPDAMTGPATKGYKAAVVFILKSNSVQQLTEDTDTIRSSVEVVTKS